MIQPVPEAWREVVPTPVRSTDRTLARTSRSTLEYIVPDVSDGQWRGGTICSSRLRSASGYKPRRLKRSAEARFSPRPLIRSGSTAVSQIRPYSRQRARSRLVKGFCRSSCLECPSRNLSRRGRDHAAPGRRSRRKPPAQYATPGPEPHRRHVATGGAASSLHNRTVIGSATKMRKCGPPF